MAVTLALDLASRTGYAIRNKRGVTKVGIWTLNRGTLVGKRNPVPGLRLLWRLERLQKRCPVDKAIFEESFVRGGEATYRLHLLENVVTMWAMQHNIPWQRVRPSDWKKAVLNNGHAKKEDYVKAALERWPDMRFWCDDQCAAMWLLEYEQTVGQ